MTRVLALRASWYRQATVASYARDKPANEAASDDKSTCQWKERGNEKWLFCSDALLPVQSLTASIMQVGHIKPVCAKWKAMRTPKLVTLVVGSSRGNEEAWSVVQVVTGSWIT